MKDTLLEKKSYQENFLSGDSTVYWLNKEGENCLTLVESSFSSRFLLSASIQNISHLRWPTGAKHNAKLPWKHNKVSWNTTIFYRAQWSFVEQKIFHRTQQSFTGHNYFTVHKSFTTNRNLSKEILKQFFLWLVQ